MSNSYELRFIQASTFYKNVLPEYFLSCEGIRYFELFMGIASEFRYLACVVEQIRVLEIAFLNPNPFLFNRMISRDSMDTRAV